MVKANKLIPCVTQPCLKAKVFRNSILDECPDRITLPSLCLWSVSKLRITQMWSAHTHTLLLKAFMLLHLVFFYTKSDLRQKFRPRLQSHLNTPDQSLRGLICPNGLFQRVPNCVFQTPHPDQLGSFRHCGLCCALLVAVSEC